MGELLKNVDFKGWRIEVTSFSNIVDECDALEFRRGGGRDVDIVVSQRDDEPENLYIAVNGEVDVDYVAFAIDQARSYFGGSRASVDQ